MTRKSGLGLLLAGALIFQTCMTTTAAAVSLRVSTTVEVATVLADYSFRYCLGDSHTAKAKRYDVDYFRSYLDSCGIKTLHEITPKVFSEFIDSRLSLGEAISTVCRRADTVRHFLEYCSKENPGFRNPASEVRNPRGVKRKPQGLTIDELDSLRQAAHGPLERLIIELGARAGLRRETIRDLNYSQLVRDNNRPWWFRDVEVKARRWMDIAVNESVKAALIEYFPERDELLERRGIKDGRAFPLLLSHYKNDPAKPETFRYSTEAIHDAVERIGKRAGIKAFPHKLRHTFAHDLYSATGNIMLVSQALGHSHVTTTQIYIQQRDEEIESGVSKLK